MQASTPRPVLDRSRRFAKHRRHFGQRIAAVVVQRQNLALVGRQVGHCGHDHLFHLRALPRLLRRQQRAGYLVEPKVILLPSQLIQTEAARDGDQEAERVLRRCALIAAEPDHPLPHLLRHIPSALGVATEHLPAVAVETIVVQIEQADERGIFSRKEAGEQLHILATGSGMHGRGRLRGIFGDIW